MTFFEINEENFKKKKEKLDLKPERRMFNELSDGFFLLVSVLGVFDIMRTGDGGDAAAVVAVSGGDALGVNVAERAAAEVAAASLKRENVLLRMRSSSGASDDDGHGLEGAGGGDETNGELNFC